MTKRSSIIHLPADRLGPSGEEVDEQGGRGRRRRGLGSPGPAAQDVGHLGLQASLLARQQPARGSGSSSRCCHRSAPAAGRLRRCQCHCEHAPPGRHAQRLEADNRGRRQHVQAVARQEHAGQLHRRDESRGRCQAAAEPGRRRAGQRADARGLAGHARRHLLAAALHPGAW